MPKLSRLTRTSLLLAFFFGADKVVAFAKTLLSNRIVGLDGMGIFGAATNVPNYLSALLSGGALGIAFIPVLTEYLDHQGRRQAWDLFARVVNLAFLLTGLISLAIIAAAGPLVRYIIAPGFSSSIQVETVSLMRLDLVAILIFSISGLVTCGLEANQHFLLPALAPIFYDIGQIFGVVFLTPSRGLHLGPLHLPAFGLGLNGLVFGVILGAALHLLIQVPGLIRYQFRWRPVIGFNTPGMRRVLVLFWPRILTMAAIQVYFVARDSLASHFGTSGVGALNLAWTVEQVPETIFGTAIAVAMLPSLAEFIDHGRRQEYIETLNRALRVVLALSLPSAVLIALTVRPFSAVFFQFSTLQLNLLTDCTWAFMIGLLADAWLETAVRAYYARQDTRTPLLAAALQALAFVLLSLALEPLLGLAGIPLAASLTLTAQALVLLLMLGRSFPGLFRVGGTALRAVLAGLLAGATAYALLHYLPLAPLFSASCALIAGTLVAVPLIWKELRQIFAL
jgi:putative peptidoglycan lipid II flippase